MLSSICLKFLQQLVLGHFLEELAQELGTVYAATQQTL